MSPGEGEVHEADDGEAEQGDGVRPVEEVDGDVLHLLLVDHPEMHLVVHIIFAQGPAPHAGRHDPPPRPAAAAAPARVGWDPGGDEPQGEGELPDGGAGSGAEGRLGAERRAGAEGGVAAPPMRRLEGDAADRARPRDLEEAFLWTRCVSGLSANEAYGKWRAGERKLLPPAGSFPRRPPDTPAQPRRWTRLLRRSPRGPRRAAAPACGPGALTGARWRGAVSAA